MANNRHAHDFSCLYFVTPAHGHHKAALAKALESGHLGVSLFRGSSRRRC